MKHILLKFVFLNDERTALFRLLFLYSFYSYLHFTGLKWQNQKKAVKDE